MILFLFLPLELLLGLDHNLKMCSTILHFQTTKSHNFQLSEIHITSSFLSQVCKAQQHCHRPLGVPGEEEQINIVLFVNENLNNNELKRLQSVSRVCQHVESRIWYTFRISMDWQRIGSLVQRAFNFWSNVGILYVTLFG